MPKTKWTKAGQQARTSLATQAEGPDSPNGVSAAPPFPETTSDNLPVAPAVTEPIYDGDEDPADYPPVELDDKPIQIFCLAIAAGHPPMKALAMSGDTWMTPKRCRFLLENPVVQAELRAYVKPLLLQPDIAKVWASRHLENIAEASVMDFLTVRPEREYVRAKDGTILIDDQGVPIYNLRQRIVVTPNIHSMPRAQLQNIKKIKVKRREDGDEIEMELYDRHKAVVDLAMLAGLKPQPAPAPNTADDSTYLEYTEALSSAEEENDKRLKALRAAREQEQAG